MEYPQEMTYKQICAALGDAEKQGGKQREVQLKEWNRKFEIEKVGRNKYIIKRELNEQEVKLKRNRQEFSRYLQLGILYLVAKQEGNYKTYTYRDLREHLTLVRPEYYITLYGKNNLTINEDVVVNMNTGYVDTDNTSLLGCQKWFHISNNIDKDAIRYALNHLKEKGFITLSQTYMLFKTQKIDSINVPLKRVANLEEKQEIDHSKEDFAKEKGLKAFNQIYFSETPRGKELKKEGEKRIKECILHMGYTCYARAFTLKASILPEKAGEFSKAQLNKLQVDRYSTNPKLVEISKEINEQLINNLIKI